MTDGRFEAVNSIRPRNWDNRRLWCERDQFIKLDPEIRYDESCPFHDLKADGCFQPELGLIHDNERALTPGTLNKRPDGNRLKFGGPQPRDRMGMGGYLLPFDSTGPGKPWPRKSERPWASGRPYDGLFQTPEYMACPPAAPSLTASAAPHMPAGRSIKLGGPIPYMPDDKAKVPNTTKFRLRTGTYIPKALQPVLAPIDSKKDATPKPKRPINRARYTNSILLGKAPSVLPDPYNGGPLDARRGGPLFTYAAKSKRTPPIQATWSTLVQTADPLRGYTTSGGSVGDLIGSTPMIPSVGRFTNELNDLKGSGEYKNGSLVMTHTNYRSGGTVNLSSKDGGVGGGTMMQQRCGTAGRNDRSKMNPFDELSTYTEDYKDRYGERAALNGKRYSWVSKKGGPDVPNTAKIQYGRSISVPATKGASKKLERLDRLFKSGGPGSIGVTEKASDSGLGYSRVVFKDVPDTVGTIGGGPSSTKLSSKPDSGCLNLSNPVVIHGKPKLTGPGITDGSVVLGHELGSSYKGSTEYRYHYTPTKGKSKVNPMFV